MSDFADLLGNVDGIAGLAALINGLLLWPIVRAHKADRDRMDKRLDKHDERLSKLEPK